MIPYVSLAAIIYWYAAFALVWRGLAGVDSGTVNDALGSIERVGSWQVGTLIVALFVFLIICCFLAIKTTRADMREAKAAMESLNKEHHAELKAMHSETKVDREAMIRVLERNNIIVTDNSRLIERNNILFERLERQLHDRPASDRK